jgi:Glyoxalase-like domain
LIERKLNRLRRAANIAAAARQRKKGLIVLQLDHITVAANSLAEGIAHAERALGLAIPAGGAHALMGTHNHLLRLGDSLFLEIIAPDPDAGSLSRPRWFALDDPKMRAALTASPRLATWVIATPDIASALKHIPHADGPAISVSRGNLEWQISVSADGSMPFNGAFPTLIQWPDGPHPALGMPDLGCSLFSLEIAHPEADLIGRSLGQFFADPRVRFSTAPFMSMRAAINTTTGIRHLS